MIADRFVLGFLVIGFLVLLVGFISTVLRWMSNDARARGRNKWIPADHTGAFYEHPEEYKQHVTGFLHTFFPLDKAAAK
jgi:hypothetical protein